MKCADILGEAEELCTLKIEEIMERFDNELKTAIVEANAQCTKTQDRAVNITRTESNKLFKEMEKRERERAEVLFLMRATEEREKAEVTFQQRADEEKAKAEV